MSEIVVRSCSSVSAIISEKPDTGAVRIICTVFLNEIVAFVVLQWGQKSTRNQTENPRYSLDSIPFTLCTKLRPLSRG